MKKIYYFPGLISALLIPVLFWYYIHPYIDKTVYNVVDIGLPAKLRKDNYNQNATFEPLRNWNYKKIAVPPNEAKNNSDFFVSEIKAMQKRNEKNSGIEFILSDKNTYADLISILNDMHISKNDMYAIDTEKTGNIFAVHYYVEPTKEKESEYLLCNDLIYEVEEPTFMDKFLAFNQHSQTVFENASKLPKGACYILFAFLLFLNISMFSIKERFQLKLQ
jgi:anaerobic selenocysteine-containing dehydrogenase